MLGGAGSGGGHACSRATVVAAESATPNFFRRAARCASGSKPASTAAQRVRTCGRGKGAEGAMDAAHGACARVLTRTETVFVFGVAFGVAVGGESVVCSVLHSILLWRGAWPGSNMGRV